MTKQKFVALKRQLTKNNIAYTKGYSEYNESKKVHDFIELVSVDVQIYNDSDYFVIDFGENYFIQCKTIKEVVEELKLI